MTSNHTHKADDWSECPEGDMDYIADMLGSGFRDKMIATMGGITVKVPSKVSTLTDDHQLVCCLGRIDAEELVDTVPSAIIYIPKGAHQTSKLDQVIALVQAGKANPQIARTLGISDRMVRRYRAKAGLNGNILARRLGVPARHLSKAIGAGHLAIAAG